MMESSESLIGRGFRERVASALRRPGVDVLGGGADEGEVLQLVELVEG